MSVNESNKKSRGPKKYWITKNGKLYARFQYITEQGESRDKYKSITDKRDARGAVETMRRELEHHGEEALHSDKVTFGEVVDRYEEIDVT